ncbi:MAG: 6-phosphofructokinase [Gammaproteobacteria bacterium]|nr:6-phosphofructokinase [Gammaproteobacteria bacterium]
MLKNIFYAQSGGPTAVINTSACGVIETARAHSDKIGKVLVGRNGIIGALKEELYDTTFESSEAIAALRYTPTANIFGTCRYKLKGLEENKEQYERLMEVFAAHNIGYFFYNGGGDSQDTAHKVSLLSQQMGYPLVCIGIPKTVDNDLSYTDTCPGFGSVAKYIAISTLEAGMDVKGMAATSTKVFIMEVMGRHSGWIAAASGLASHDPSEPPHIILFPEIPFDEPAFLKRVDHCVKTYGYCVVIVSEGVRDKDNKFIAESDAKDAFGHAQLGGVAPYIADMIKQKLNYKNHWAVPDYLQRSARHIASKTDIEQAYALGKAAIDYALAGKGDVMLTIERIAAAPYQWRVGDVALQKVANVERKMPRDFISQNGYEITEKCREYLQPLIQGEDYPPYQNGIPQYARLQNCLMPKKLETIFEV